jgi:hypothetical protein
MRNVVIGICSFVFFLLLLMVGYTVTGREKRYAELESALNFAMEQTMERLEYPDEFSPVNDEQLAALFEQLFLAQITAKADYEIQILDIDCEKGLLSVEVTEHYTHLNGHAGSITAQKLVLLDQTEGEGACKTVELTFWVGEQVYRRYEMTAGSAIVIPRTPYLEKGTFAGWRSLDDGKLYTEDELNGMKINGDLSFLAEEKRK